MPFSSIHDAHASDARLRPSKISPPAPLSQARVTGSGSGMPDRFFHNKTRTPPLDADNPGGRLGFGNLAGFVVGAQQAEEARTELEGPTRISGRFSGQHSALADSHHSSSESRSDRLTGHELEAGCALYHS